MAQTLTINDKSYDIEELSDEAKTLLKNVSYTDAKLTDLKREIAVVQTARNAYLQALSISAEKSGDSKEESKDDAAAEE